MTPRSGVEQIINRSRYLYDETPKGMADLVRDSRQEGIRGTNMSRTQCKSGKRQDQERGGGGVSRSSMLATIAIGGKLEQWQSGRTREQAMLSRYVPTPPSSKRRIVSDHQGAHGISRRGSVAQAGLFGGETMAGKARNRGGVSPSWACSSPAVCMRVCSRYPVVGAEGVLYRCRPRARPPTCPGAGALIMAETSRAARAGDTRSVAEGGSQQAVSEGLSR